MGGDMFSPCYWTWGQTMVEVMKIMLPFFKRSHAHTAVLSALTLQQATTVPGLHQRLLDTHGQVWVSPLWCPFLLDPGAHRFCLCPARVCSGGSIVRLMVTSSKRAYAIPRSAAPKALPLQQATADLYFNRRHSNTHRQVWLSLCGVYWCT